MGGHVGLDVTGTAGIGLDASLQHVLPRREQPSESIDGQLRNTIDGLGPTLVGEAVVCHSGLELTHQLQQLFLGELGILEAFFELGVGHPLEGDGSGRR